LFCITNPLTGNGTKLGDGVGFRDEIEKRLEGLSREQVRWFAWLCGMRALPFLSIQRKFTYWPRGKRQRHLYAIFNALDAAAYAFAVANACDVDTTYATSRAVNDAISAAYAADFPVHFDDTYDTYAARAAGAVANAAADAARAATAAAAVNAATSATDAAYAINFRIGFEKMIFHDLEAIKSGKFKEINKGTVIYGKIWPNFLEDLRTVGCDYWARYYENLFERGFVIDEEELKRRLSVPDETKAEGAAVVGQFLERINKDIEAGIGFELLNETRIIILGEKGAGKTSLAKRLINIKARMPMEKESTEGVETSIWSFPDKDGDKNINAHIWDFAGHSITHSAHRCFMSARCLYIYVYNGRIERDNDHT